VNRADLKELHYITPIENIPSVMRHGILSHRNVTQIQHSSFAKEGVQDLRARKRVPQGRLLHEYANLYFCARNPALYLAQKRHDNLCLLLISPDILDNDDVVVTDGNAASHMTRFLPPSGLERIDADIVFAEYWTDHNPIIQAAKKRIQCAEVLVPDKVDPGFIIGIRVQREEDMRIIKSLGFPKDVILSPDSFFP